MAPTSASLAASLGDARVSLTPGAAADYGFLAQTYDALGRPRPTPAQLATLSTAYATFLEVYGAQALHTALIEERVRDVLERTAERPFDWVVFSYSSSSAPPPRVSSARQANV